jgi:SAM-dependent methyltransferase
VALFEWLAAVSPDRGLAWDCATGSGQAARDLAKRFDHVIATDASASQIDRALPAHGVDYRVAAAEDSGLEPGSVGLVTVAQALHWFAIDRFFAECERVLKPGGLLALWTYGPQTVAGAAVDRIVQHYYRDIVGPYWPAERALVDSGYVSISLPFPELATPAFGMSAEWSLERLLGYLGTWSATTAYRAAVGTDPLDLIRAEISTAWGDPGVPRTIVWPLTVRAGRKPGGAVRAK